MPKVRIGSLEDLRKAGCLTGKAGNQPICVFWQEDRAYAVDDRCPHMGFPLHRGTVENGLVTCHWHHARFDLESGGTLDPFADDVRAYPVEVEGDDVVIVVEPASVSIDHLYARLEEGLEQGLTLVTAKAVLGLLEAGAPPADIVRAGVDFGTRYRDQGWGAGLTVLVAMANLVCHLDPADRPLALVHGLAFVSRDTRGRAPRFPLGPLERDGGDVDRLTAWYRRFIETRSEDPAERTLQTALRAVAARDDLAPIHGMMTAAVTDHVFIDEGHVLDFTNKAFEALEHLGPEAASTVLPTLVRVTARATRHEEGSQWRHPVDLVALIDDAVARLPELLAKGRPSEGTFDDVGGLAWRVLDDDASAVIQSLCDAIAAGANPDQLGRAVALAASLRIVRFHVQNDHNDWDVVHHGFTTANALHQCLVRTASPDLMRGLFDTAMKVYLDRFLNVPAARLPRADGGSADLSDLQECWDAQGRVDEAGAVVYRFLANGGDPSRVIAALGSALLAESAEFHWFQTVEAAVTQFHAWPASSEEARLLLVGAARFLAAHTPTRRELAQVVKIATRLRRGEPLYEEM